MQLNMLKDHEALEHVGFHVKKQYRDDGREGSSISVPFLISASVGFLVCRLAFLQLIYLGLNEIFLCILILIHFI